MKGIYVILVAGLAAGAFAENECPADQAENWQIEQLLVHADCEKFYKCTYGQPVEIACPTELYFNLETWECDWKNNVDCGDRNVPEEDRVPTSESDSESSESSESVQHPKSSESVQQPESSESVQQPESSESVQQPESSESVQQPESSESVQQPESSESVQKSESSESVQKSESSESVQQPKSSEEKPKYDSSDSSSDSKSDDNSKASSEEQDSDFLDNGCPVDPHVHWLLPHETECTSYYYCVWGQKVLRPCSGGLHFNPSIQVCDWPHDAGCVHARSSLNKHFESRQMMKQMLM